MRRGELSACASFSANNRALLLSSSSLPGLCGKENRPFSSAFSAHKKARLPLDCTALHQPSQVKLRPVMSKPSTAVAH